jgi:hypothetical protein
MTRHTSSSHSERSPQVLDEPSVFLNIIEETVDNIGKSEIEKHHVKPSHPKHFYKKSEVSALLTQVRKHRFKV